MYFKITVASQTPQVTADVLATFTMNSVYKICGVGSTKNEPNYPTSKLKCTTVVVVPIANCAPPAADGLRIPLDITPPDETVSICVAPSEGNTCAGKNKIFN